MRTISWGALTLILVGCLAAEAFWIATSGRSSTANMLVWQWAIVTITMLMVYVAAGYRLFGKVAGILIDERNRMSLARFQWVCWFTVIFGAYFVGAVLNTARGLSLPDLQTDMFFLIGITTAGGVASKVLVDAKLNQRNPNAVNSPTLQGVIVKHASAQEASWSDLYLGEEEGNYQVVDVSRLQKLIATIMLAAVYLEMLLVAFRKFGADPKMAFNMPEPDKAFVGLMAVSYLGYLAFKAAPKSPT